MPGGRQDLRSPVAPCPRPGLRYVRDATLPHVWRRRREPDAAELFRAAGGACGARTTLNGRLRVAGPVVVGDGLVVDGIDYPVVLAALPDAELRIGDRAYLNRGADISAWRSIVIGDNLRMGEFASIQDWEGHA